MHLRRRTIGKRYHFIDPFEYFSKQSIKKYLYRYLRLYYAIVKFAI